MKLIFIFDAKDRCETVNGTKVELNRIAIINDVDDALENKAHVDARQTDMKDFRRRSKKAASLVTQTRC